MSDLTKPPAPVGGIEVSRVDVKVLSKSNPAPGLLRLARVAVQTEPEISDLFKQARTEGRPAEWLKERIVPELEKCFPGEPVEQEATYLADEFTQIGDSILLVSAETGRALARITDDDLYQPAPLPRESGNMVTPAKRLKPEIEGFIVQWTFDQARERETVEHLLERLPQTDLLRADGDSRLLFTSRPGRRVLASQIQSALPSLLETPAGLPRAFLDFFPLGKPPEGGLTCLKDLKAFGTSRHLLQDPLARNLRFDVRQSLTSASATSWVRDLACHLVYAATQEGRLKKVGSAEALRGRTGGLWIATPNTARYLQGQARFLPAPVVSSEPFEAGIYLSEPAGYLEVDPDGFWCRTKEFHDKWTVETEMGANLWVDWSKLYAVELTDVPMTGQSVELL